MAKRCVGCMKMKDSSPVCEHCGYNEHVPNENHQLPIGTILQGRYQVGKVLGQGGFGITYIGWDTALETPVAIKEYYPGSLVHRESTQNLTVSCTGSNVAELYAQNRERFLREARILAKLQNVPGIVRVQNLFADNNTAYIIMEYVDGINLKQYIRMQNRVLTVSETLAVMQPVMRALNKVHQAELVHRDISPDNIMIQKDGSVVLLDFGAARQVEHADVNHDLTRSTQTILKHGFAPIEQYRSRGNLGPWTDVYALCATMYYCLTGKVPSEAPERVMGDDNVNWKQIPGLTEPQIAVLEQGMAMLPEKRVGSVKELYEALFGQRPVTEVSAQPKKAEPEVVSAPPVEKPAVIVGKSITDYPAYTVDLEETTPAPKENSVPSAPVVMETNQTKKKKPVGVIAAAVLAVVAAVGLFAMKPKQKAPESAQTNVTEAPAPIVVNPEKITLKVWAPLDAQYDESSFLPQALTKFEEAHPEYKITWEISVCEAADAGNIVSANVKNGPDVYLFANDQLGMLLEAGALTKLSGAYLDDVRTNNSEAIANSVTYQDGGVYAFPCSSNTWFMYYNKAYYTEEDIKSLDSMMAKKPISFPISNSWYLSAFYFAAGGTMFGDGTDGSQDILFNNSKCVSVTTYLAEMLKAGKIIDDANGSGIQDLQNRKVGAVFSGSWDEAQIREILGSNFGVAKLPCVQIDGTQCQMYAFAGCKAYGINPNTQHAKAAFQLARWLASPEMQLLYYQTASIFPCSVTLAQDNSFSADAVAKANAETIAYTSKMQPSIPEMFYYWDPMHNFGIELVSGYITGNNAAQKISTLHSEMNR